MISLTDFAQRGVNSDLKPWTLPGGHLTDVNNVRIANGKLFPSGGYKVVTTLPIGFDPSFLMFANTSGGKFWIVAGLDKVYVYDFFGFHEVSATGAASGYWNGCMLGGVPILCHKDRVPEYWQPQSISQPLQALPWDGSNTWDDVNEYAEIIRSHKQFLFALGIVSGGVEYPDSIRWSSPADVGQVPETWDPLDTTNVAGFIPLGSAGGRIVDGKSLRDAFVIYREKGIVVADYVGGTFVWRFRQLDTATGAISKDSIIEANGMHYFIGDGDIYATDGNDVKSILHNRLRDRFRADYNPDAFANAYAIRNDASSEAWFCIPTDTNEYASRAYVYNWRDDSWSIRDLPIARFADYGKQETTETTWDSDSSTWDSDETPWNERASTPLNDAIFAITGTELIVLDNQETGDYLPFNSLIERQSLTIEGIFNTITINRIYPHITGPGKVYIQLGAQDYPGSAIRWKAQELFDPNTQRSITTRVTGELHCFRITNADNLHWEFSGMDISYLVAGER